MAILFITGSREKFTEAKSVIPELEQKEMELAEIQGIDPTAIIKHKLEEANRETKGQIVVEDTSFYLDCLNGLPGPLVKWFMKALGCDGLWQIAKNSGNTRAAAKVIIGYKDRSSEPQFFEGITSGQIVEPRGDKGWGWDPIFLPDGYNKTFGEMNPEEKYGMSMRRSAFEKLKVHLDEKV